MKHIQLYMYKCIYIHIFMKCTLLFPLIFSPLKYIFWKTIYDQLVNHISVMSGAFTNETRHCAVCLPPGSAAQVCENTLNETIIALQRFCVHYILLADTAICDKATTGGFGSWWMPAWGATWATPRRERFNLGAKALQWPLGLARREGERMMLTVTRY